MLTTREKNFRNIDHPREKNNLVQATRARRITWSRQPRAVTTLMFLINPRGDNFDVLDHPRE